ncbi:ABC transporter ATP-binding protein [Marinivivus vitaminiproducens]|uniref:ABC transporter ATP-binding protein n=1 Tax=Marinivivus vitaminiproducens TaxID=3035935 RepID=UPI00279F7BB0|nr:ABC transporter ATP-binding protein [Geminicoccaceae bacterium SCSIO 64248]
MNALAQVSPPSSRGHLEARGVTVSFGGLRALDGVDIDMAPGAFTGVIGPNGSGKSTLLNVISGVQPTDRSSIRLDGRAIDDLSSAARARIGIARTFQALRLFDGLSVLDNVMMGAHRLFTHNALAGCLHLPGTRREQRQRTDEVLELLEVFGTRLLPRLDHQVVSLSYANRRRVEIARALALRPSLLLLDEPCAGMNPAESEELADQLPELAAMTGCSVLLVEHKMDVISSVCRNVYVLDHGLCLMHGTPAEVQRDERVVEAFLGVE